MFSKKHNSTDTFHNIKKLKKLWLCYYSVTKNIVAVFSVWSKFYLQLFCLLVQFPCFQ